MHAIAFAVALFSLQPALAEDMISFRDLAGAVTPEQPLCFGREYSASHLRAHPLQTVQLLRAKLSKQAGSEGNFLEVEAVLKGDANRFKLFRQFFVCMDDGTCAVECDGGSVSLAGLRDGGLHLRNNGFVLEGGCDGGGERETVFLGNKRGGDDLFRLSRLPHEYCSPTTDER